MNIKWKDAAGLLALVLGFILSGLSLTKKMSEPADSTSAAVIQKVENHKPSVNHKKRQIQSLQNSAKIQKATKDPQDISDLLQCYQNESCPFPNNDPREYKLAVGKAIKKQLRSALARLYKGTESNPQQWKEWAHQALKVSDGHVKEAALDVLSTQEPSKDILTSIIKDVIHFHDPHLISQAMTELQKYMTPKYEDIIYSELSKSLKTGSLMVKREVAQNIIPFMNDRSLPYFQDSLSQMNPQSNVHTVLYKVIKDYKNQKTGA